MASIHRYAVLLSLCAYVSAIVGPAGNTTKSAAQKTDTYLEAYSKSRIEAEKAKQSKGVVIVTAKDGEKKIANREDSVSGYDYSPPSYSSDGTSFSSSGSSFSGPSPSHSYQPPSSYGPPVKFESEITYNAPTNTYGPPSNTYGPPASTYGPPANTYGPPPNTYGPPANTYGPPANTYGPPANTYGPPANTYGPPAHSYGPPAQSYGPPIHKPLPPVYGPPIKPSYGIPYAVPGLSFLDKLSFKLDILTVAKLMLKLLIFKKIVTMIAVVCMLLVIPKLISFKKDAHSPNNDEEDRKFSSSNVVELTSAQQLLDRAISVFGRKQPGCGVTCRMRRVVDDIYDFQPYFRQDT